MSTFIERHRFILAFVVLSSLAGLSVGVAKVTTSLYAISLNATAIELSLIAGAQSIGVLLMSMPVGVLVDQYGPKRLFMLGSFLAGIGYLLISTVHVPLYLAIGSMFVSFCMPTRFVSMNAVFMQQLEKVGIARAGWFRATHMIGFFLLGPALAVGIIHHMHYAGTYVMIALSFVLTAALAPIVMNHYTKPKGPAKTLSIATLKGQFSLLRRDRELLGISAIEFISQAITQFYTFFIVAIAIKEYGFGASTAAGLVSVQGATFVIALFTMGAWVARVDRKHFYQFSIAVIGIALVLLGVTHQPALLWLGGGGLGLGLGMLQTVNISRFAEVGARVGRGSAAGVNAFVGPAGGLTGSALGGMIGQLLGLQKTFLVFVPILLCLSFAIRRSTFMAAVNFQELNLVPVESES